MQSPAASAPPTPSPAGRLGAAAETLRRGAVAAALDELTAIAEDESARAPMMPQDIARLQAMLLDCRLARGELSEAITLGEELSGHLVRRGLAAAIAHHAHGELASALGEPELAATHHLSAGLAAAGLAEDPEMLPWRASAALVMVRTGERREAVRLAAEHHAVALRHPSSYALATSWRTLATADPGDQRISLLREARAVLAGSPAARLAAQVDADLAGLLLLTNRPADITEAVALLRGAELYAGREELWPLQGRVRRMLDRCDEAPLRATSEALALLTGAERRVAGLAASGLTNRQIAEQLMVTVKAVEWHLSRTYRKLGISSRAGLASTFGVPA